MRNTPSLGAKELHAYDAPAANTAALVTIAADEHQVWVIDQIDYSVDRDLATAETLTVTIDGTTVWQIRLPVLTGHAINGQFLFPKGLHGAKNEAVVVTLSAAAGGEISNVNVFYH